METYKLPTGIMRFEQGNTRGWWVRVMREGTMFRKLFSDNVHGSPEIALENAKKYLGELNEAFPKTRKSRIRKEKRKGASGPIPGVWKQKTYSRGHEYWAWIVQWCPEPGEVKTRSFSVNKHGDAGAMRKAIGVRLAELEKLKGEHPEEYKEQIKEIPAEYINSGVLAFPLPDKSGNAISLLPYAYEGENKYSIHLLIERSKSLRQSKIEKFIEEHGSIFCELCQINMKTTYPWLTMDYIEVHHIVPLSELNEPTCNSLEDLVLLCPNCHMAVHQGSAQDNLLEAMIYFEKDLL